MDIPSRQKRTRDIGSKSDGEKKRKVGMVLPKETTSMRSPSPPGPHWGRMRPPPPPEPHASHTLAPRAAPYSVVLLRISVRPDRLDPNRSRWIQDREEVHAFAQQLQALGCYKFVVHTVEQVQYIYAATRARQITIQDDISSGPCTLVYRPAWKIYRSLETTA